jgi:hypothetical protein
VSISLHKEHQVPQLQHLTNPQLEQALAWLDSPVQSAPPQELKELSQVEWYLLRQLLDQLLLEREHNPVQ